MCLFIVISCEKCEHCTQATQHQTSLSSPCMMNHLINDTHVLGDIIVLHFFSLSYRHWWQSWSLTPSLRSLRAYAHDEEISLLSCVSAFISLQSAIFSEMSTIQILQRQRPVSIFFPMFAPSQERPQDPRKEGNAPKDRPPWKNLPRGKFTEITMECSDSASSIAAYKKRDSAGTLLVDIAMSDAGGGKAEEPCHEPAAASSSKPQEDSFSEVPAAFGTLCISYKFFQLKGVCFLVWDSC